MTALLSYGKHPDAEGEGCVMEVCSYLAGEAWSDHPVCVDETIANFAIDINDLSDTEDRQVLLNYVNRFIGTNYYYTTLSQLILKHDKDSESLTEDELAIVAAAQDLDVYLHSPYVDFTTDGALQLLDEILSGLEALNNMQPKPITELQLAILKEAFGN